MKELTLKEAENLLAIDKDDLTEELIKGPSILGAVGRNYVVSCDVRDRAKDFLSKTEAKIFNRLKKTSDKSSDFSVKQRVSTNKEVAAALEEYREAKLLAAKWEILKETFNQRGWMLKQLAELYMAQFYSSDYSRPEIDRTKSSHRRRKKSNS